MKQQIQQRLTELHAEFEAGQKMLADLEAKQANLRETLLRISGAIQVLEKLVKHNDSVSVTALAHTNGIPMEAVDPMEEQPAA